MTAIDSGGRESRSEMEPSDIFREEARQHHAHDRLEGDVLRVSPTWAGKVYRLLVAIVVVAALFAFFGHVKEYATGRAIIRTSNRLDVTAVNGGSCSSVDVTSGDRVVAGQVLVRFYAGSQAAEFRRIDRASQLLLIDLLTDPADRSVRRRLAELRAEREWARSRLEEQEQRAPVDGLVADVRIRAGQFVQPGEVVVTIRSDSTDESIVALIPGRFGPELRPGMELKVTMDGYAFAYARTRIQSVSSEVLGPAAVRRVLGREAAEGVPLSEPVLLVTAPLPAATFRAGGEEHPYKDGMQGRADVEMRGVPIITALIPGWQDLVAGRRD